MENFDKIGQTEMMKVPHFHLDEFQTRVLNNLHLEFFLKKCRFIITPDYRYLLTGEADEKETGILDYKIPEKREALEKLKLLLIYDLSLYSALLETNSYYIASNGHLLICRFNTVKDHPEAFELKLYTISRDDLPENYKDKIYLGRDYISIKNLRKEHFGLRYMRNSLIEQLMHLRARMMELLPEETREDLEEEFLSEVEELIGEFAEASNRIMEKFPVEINTRTLERESLVQANAQFRNLKHILMEIEESLREMEQNLFEKDSPRAVRYVTKFKKDVVNDINTIMFKINGRISDAVNGIHG
ncbi:MAG TPA: hypothetical protein PKE49_09110 [Leptospiraceae bacterium]|nr:hypothetical protein [Leptospirales bacterium]HMX56667.1 hypothetical protein [Leptospiraceae bacterium]HMY47431.1 hypothetical protein [Leptospiraceae bacterium]HMZ37224.1 hypothetical protein [Leptospiraceae bacterium]HNJ33775.1 hypothetical protein [Leptospiraceae bacterium]